MNCSSCGANLPPGATSCPVCGVATPYNAPAGSSPQYSPPDNYSPGQGNQQIDPTVAASPYGLPPNTPTAYGTPPYGAPPPPPSQLPAPQAGFPYNPNQYGAPPQQNAYGAPPFQQGGYGPQVQQGQPGTFGMQPPPKRRSRVGLIIAIVLGVLVLLCIGFGAILYSIGKGAVSTVNATATAVSGTSTTSSNVTPTTNAVTPTIAAQTPAPSGVSIDPTAASYITNPQMSSAVDSTFRPTAPATTFTTKDTIYATFKINQNAPDGYVLGKWYSNGQFAFQSKKPLAVKGGFTGYLAAQYNIATQGTVEYYFCTQPDCSDAKLADVVNFTVTSTGLHWTGQPPTAMMAINRPE